MTALDSLEPKEVFRHFEEISKIPRGSKEEKGISDYLFEYAQKKSFKVYQDSSYNLLIQKPGTKGYENAPTVILQAHMDMVWNKEPGFDFDFRTEPIALVVEGDTLKSYKTTLGADDGIGVAYIMALMDSQDIPHPPLELLLTTQEELGMGGAKEFNVNQLTGETFINIDSEEEGIFCSSCCGGLRIYIRLSGEELPVSEISDSDKYAFFKIEVGNLRGGHSGTEIDKERGNSNRLMGRFLLALHAKYQYYLSEINGGIAPNAISTTTSAVILAKKSEEEAIQNEVTYWKQVFRNELKNSDGKPDAEGKVFEVQLSMKPAAVQEHVFSKNVLNQVITAATLFPHGVAAMDLNLTEQKIPETSSNFAMIGTFWENQKKYILFTANIRSSVSTKKEFIKNQFIKVADQIGATYTMDGEYPAWEFDPDSQIRNIFIEAYEQVYEGKKPKVEGIHAGLECGIFSDHFKTQKKKVDMIAFGPDIFGAHTPQEQVNIPSVERSWRLLKKVLEMIK